MKPWQRGQAAWPSPTGPAAWPVLAGALLVASLGLQGCDVPRVEGYYDLGTLELPTHSVPFWRQKMDYFMANGHTDPETMQLKFNSCMNEKIDVHDVCSGRGICKPWDTHNIDHPLFFCECYSGWAGPECTTRRKSQLKAWGLSLLFGLIGADEHYLGYHFWGVVKIFPTFLGALLCWVGYPHTGGLVLLPWWIVDIVRIGSAQVQARPYMVEPDLPRWMFQVFTLLFVALLGFGLGVNSIFWNVKQRRRSYDETLHYSPHAGKPGSRFVP